MTIGDEDYLCRSTFSTPLRAFAPFTITESETTPDSPRVVYQSTGCAQNDDAEDCEVSTKANITTLSSGLAVADSISIYWEDKDLSLFPSAYALSVAQQFKVPTFTPMPAPGTSSALPRETNPPPPSSGLSTGAKAGIGVGAVVGAAAIVGLGLLSVCLRRRRRRRVTVGTPGNELPEMVVKEDDPPRRE